jgi:exodeoxyribonuclease-3
MTARFSIATWNVNSVRPRLEALCEWLSTHKPDILLLQETKVVDEAFPAEPIEDLGYNLALHGQKTYNGVAMLSRTRLESVSRGLPGWEHDEARFIEASTTVHGVVVRVASVYVPNGQEVGSEKFTRKLAFLEALDRMGAEWLASGELCLLGGDFNVAPYPADVYDPRHLEGTVCYHPEERARLRAMLHRGWQDAWRIKHPEASGDFTWWDYRSQGFERDHGLRIDHLLASPTLADRMQEVVIDTATRGRERPSDHAPVMAWFE